MATMPEITVRVRFKVTFWDALKLRLAGLRNVPDDAVKVESGYQPDLDGSPRGIPPSGGSNVQRG